MRLPLRGDSQSRTTRHGRERYGRSTAMREKKIILVGVAGGSGSGKTTFCRRLTSELGDLAAILSCDHYYRSLSHLSVAEREAVNFDHPESIDFDLLASHLSALANGESIDVPQYCFQTHDRTSEVNRAVPAPVTIVEGILLFANEPVRQQFDLRIFVDADSETRLQRRILRDVAERGRSEESVRQQWSETVDPMHGLYVAPTRHHAQLTLHTDAENEPDVVIAVARIRSLVLYI